MTGYSYAISAMDIVHATTSVLEDYLLYNTTSTTTNATATSSSSSSTASSITTSSSADAFCAAYLLLGATQNDTNVIKSIEMAKSIQQALVKKAHAMLDTTGAINCYHRIHYAYLKNNLITTKPTATAMAAAAAANSTTIIAQQEYLFARPMVLMKLGQYIMEVKRRLSRQKDGWTGSKLLPLILLSERVDGRYLVMGISPFSCLSDPQSLLTEDQIVSYYIVLYYIL